MSPGWDPGPPVDIRRVADALTIEFLRHCESVLRRAGIEHLTYPREAAAVHDKVTEALTAYDAHRTQEIAALREQVIELHNLLPSQRIVITRTPQ